MEIYDAVIVGGGPAGATAAIVLARSGRRVMLLNSSDSGFKIGESLPSAAKKLLQEIVVWNDFILDEHLPCYGNLSAWGSSYLQSTDTVFDPYGHGWHLDRRRFDSLLREKARKLGAHVYENAVLKRCDFSTFKNEKLWSLSIFTANRIIRVKSRFIIDASGRRAVVARSAGIKRIAKDRLASCYALFQPTSSVDDRDSRTIIEAVSGGWWYSALLPDRKRVAAFHTDADLIRTDPLLNTSEEFYSRLEETEHINQLIKAKGYLPDRSAKVTMANSERLEVFSGEGWAAAGDSAIAFDPLSSQGIITAIYTGMRSGQAADLHLSGKSDVLAEYNHAVAKIYDIYQANLQNWYSIEKRWTNGEFWKRRQQN